MPDEPPIFISYRRRDAAGHAGRLHEYLSGRFGDDRVFFDRSTIESGDVFPDTLRRGVEECAVLLALIGPEWLDVRGDDGGRRLDDADDFVRREIALALEQDKKIIPVLFDDAPVPPRDRLPDPLQALASCDALTLRGKTYEYQTQRRELVRLLAKVPGVPEPLPEAGEAIALPPATAIPLVFALVCHARQMPDKELLLTARITPPPDKVSEHGERVREERGHFHYALENGFTFGGLFNDLKTVVTFQPRGYFHTGMIATFGLPDLPPYSPLPGPSTHYERMVRKTENGGQVRDQIVAAIDDFLFHAAAGELATFWGRQNDAGCASGRDAPQYAVWDPDYNLLELWNYLHWQL